MKRVTKGGEVPIAAPVTAASDSPGLAGAVSNGGGLVSAWTDGEHAVPPAYPHRLNTYARAPDYDVTIEQFEEYAYARLQGIALRVAQSCNLLPPLCSAEGR